MKSGYEIRESDPVNRMKLSGCIGETSSYDKKLMLERDNPVSWLKSISAFANTLGGKLLFGVSVDGELVGLANVEKDAEDISEAIKTQIDPIPQTKLSIHEEGGKRFVVVEVFVGDETPYYIRHKGSLTAYVRIGNESVRADSTQLNRLVLKGSQRSWDSLVSAYYRKDFSDTGKSSGMSSAKSSAKSSARRTNAKGEKSARIILRAIKSDTNVSVRELQLRTHLSKQWRSKDCRPAKGCRLRSPRRRDERGPLGGRRHMKSWNEIRKAAIAL